ncbi:hypothetical protein BHM03_00013330 [Ensete ventricosum]|nr:hypothetical protein BHM03_00013330 [Ensete ventricosum]
MGRQASLPLGRQLLRALCPQSPPLWAGAIPEGGASMGATPAGANYDHMRQPCPRATAPTGSSLGREWLRLHYQGRKKRERGNKKKKGPQPHLPPSSSTTTVVDHHLLSSSTTTAAASSRPYPSSAIAPVAPSSPSSLPPPPCLHATDAGLYRSSRPKSQGAYCLLPTAITIIIIASRCLALPSFSRCSHQSRPSLPTVLSSVVPHNVAFLPHSPCRTPLLSCCRSPHWTLLPFLPSTVAKPSSVPCSCRWPHLPFSSSAAFLPYLPATIATGQPFVGLCCPVASQPCCCLPCCSSCLPLPSLIVDYYLLPPVPIVDATVVLLPMACCHCQLSAMAAALSYNLLCFLWLFHPLLPLL